MIRERLADIKDVICPSFINAHVCCILFVLLGVKIKYANRESQWMIWKCKVVRQHNSESLID